MPHWEIDGKTYPHVYSGDFRFPDWALVRETTGLDAEAFAEAHNNDDQEALPDPLVWWGYAAVAWWHGNPGVTRPRAVEEAESWQPGDTRFVADEQEDDAVPPAEAADSGGSNLNEGSSETSDASTP